MNYYNSYTDKFGLVYSVDMVRIVFKLAFEENEHIFRHLQHLADYDLDFTVKHYDRFGVFDYRHLFVIGHRNWESTVTLGFERSAKPADKPYGMIEWNPNKVNGADFDDLLRFLKVSCKSMELKRYDLAIDFPCIRSLCRLDMNSLRSYELHYENGTYTEYTGVRNAVGRVKLYDKKAESKLAYDLCRVEYTLAYDSDLLDLQTVLVSEAQIRLDLNPPSGLLGSYVNLLLEKDAPMRNRALKDLDYRTRNKIAPFLQETTLIYDTDCLFKCRDLAFAFTR